MREELDEILSTGRPWDVQLLGELTYLRACVAESLRSIPKNNFWTHLYQIIVHFRLTPVAPNVARILEKPFVFQGYHVPEGVSYIYLKRFAVLYSFF